MSGSGLDSLIRFRSILLFPLRFFFIHLPVFTIRLVFWLRNTAPLLVSRDGWSVLLRGLAAWFYHLLPGAIRDEWERHAAPPQGAPEGQAGPRRPRRDKAPPRPSRSEASDDFWGEARQRAEREREERRTAQQQRSQRAESKTRAPGGRDSSRKEKTASSSSRKSKASGQSRQREQRQGTRSSKKAATSAPPPRTDSKPRSSPPQNRPPDPGSIDFLQAHRPEFEAEQWPFDPHEGTITSGGSAMRILGVDATTSKAEIKKAYRQLAKTYMPFTMPYRPIPVQQHASAIMTALNGAKDDLL